MYGLRILIAENHQVWVKRLTKEASKLSTTVQIDVATGHEAALECLRKNIYDLAIVDLALDREPPEYRRIDEHGVEIARLIHGSVHQHRCALVIVTAYADVEKVRLLLREYNVFDVISKANFKSDRFVRVLRAALVNALSQDSSNRAQKRYKLTITFNDSAIVSTELIGPKQYRTPSALSPIPFDTADLARRADRLNILLRNGEPDDWRSEMRSIGEGIGAKLASEPQIFHDLRVARALVGMPDDANIWIQFSGPATGLGIPFELLRDEDYLVTRHIMTRRLPHGGEKRESFRDYVTALAASAEAARDQTREFRALVVGSNSDGNIPQVEDEAKAIHSTLNQCLGELGLKYHVELLTGEAAAYSRVKMALETGDYDMFHYAGHGVYDDDSPEISGLALKGEHKVEILTAHKLRLLLSRAQLRLVFLSCCLSARTARERGRADFHSVFEALVQANVPVVLGYRWNVLDSSAQYLGSAFYKHLCRTLAPEEALLEARRDSLRDLGPDDETWASIVMLMQTE